MRKVVVIAVLAVAGVLVGRRIRTRAGVSGSPPQPARPPAPPPRPAASPPPERAAEATVEPEPEPSGPPPATTNGERVVLMSISTLQERGEPPSLDAVLGHVAAGEIDPDEGTVEVLLHRLVANGCLAGDGSQGPYRLTPVGQAALADGSTARPSPAGDAADELSSPTTDA